MKVTFCEFMALLQKSRKDLCFLHYVKVRLKIQKSSKVKWYFEKYHTTLDLYKNSNKTKNIHIGLRVFIEFEYFPKYICKNFYYIF